MLSPRQIFQSLFIAVAQTTTGNDTQNLKHNILQVSYFLYRGKQIDWSAFYYCLLYNIIHAPSKHSSWWRRLDQDEDVRLSLTSSEDVFKTSSRRLGEDQYIRLGHTSSRRLQDVFKTSSRRLAKTSSRHLQDVFKTFWKRLQDIFKTFSRRIIKLKCSW